MIEWNNIKNSINDLFNSSTENDESNNDYLIVLFDNLKKQKVENNTISFKIVEIRKQGFQIKVSGLFGYISFYHMPWKYSDIESWKVIFQHIQDKWFFAKIFEINRLDKYISVKLNGEIPQFKKPNLIVGNKYSGIIIKKTDYGIFIDIGYDFNWECGSIEGMMYKSHFENIETFEELEEGQIIEIFYWGYNKKQQPIIGTDKKLKDWLTGKIEELIGDIVNVEINILDTENREYKVDNMYQGLLPVTKSIYPTMNRTQVRSAITNLKNGEIIQCEIIGINNRKRTLKLKWNSSQEMEKVISRELPKDNGTKRTNLCVYQHNSIENKINAKTVELLNFVGKTVNVEVIKIDVSLQNKYLVEGKYKGKLSISNDNYRINVKEKQYIEQNLQDGDLLNCEVLSIAKKTIRIKWKINDNELSRFINITN